MKVIVINFTDCLIALGTPRQANRFAGSPLRGIQLFTNINHSLTQIGNCQALVKRSC